MQESDDANLPNFMNVPKPSLKSEQNVVHNHIYEL